MDLLDLTFYRDLLDLTFYRSSLREWLLALLITLLVFFALKLMRALVLRQLRRFATRTTSELDDMVIGVLGTTRFWFLAAISLRAGITPLDLPDGLRGFLSHVLALLVLLQMGLWGNAALRGYFGAYTERKKAEDASKITTMRALAFVIQVALWSLLLLMALDNLGVDITALVAGLGVGGIAVALATQNILGDLFASLSIVLDKPFVYGDFIAVGDLSGTVENVGLKTTRVRSLSGEQLVFSNSDLLNSRIRNYKRMLERRIVFSFGVIYQTPHTTLQRIPGMVREIVEAQPDTRFDRAHFKAYGASSLDFEVVYYVLSPDFTLYMDRQQAINLELFRRFAEEEIEFAYPTRTVFLAREPAE